MFGSLTPFFKGHGESRYAQVFKSQACFLTHAGGMGGQAGGFVFNTTSVQCKSVLLPGARQGPSRGPAAWLSLVSPLAKSNASRPTHRAKTAKLMGAGRDGGRGSPKLNKREKPSPPQIRVRRVGIPNKAF